MNHIELGKFGENLAIKYLLNNGYQIKSKNYYYKKNEIDIVAENEDYLIIVEVKTRNTAEYGEPWTSVTKAKQKAIIQVANEYILQEDVNKNTRFDIISIVHNNHYTNIEHIIDAFSC
ncbi:MAG: YraN family protein [Flavobacteriia bacterium]|nr:YraN family protein [Flavobacteriia bacterium]